MNMGRFSSKLMHKSSFRQSEPAQKDAVWLTTPFEAHISVLWGYWSKMDMQNLFYPSSGVKILW